MRQKCLAFEGTFLLNLDRQFSSREKLFQTPSCLGNFVRNLTIESLSNYLQSFSIHFVMWFLPVLSVKIESCLLSMKRFLYVLSDFLSRPPEVWVCPSLNLDPFHHRYHQILPKTHFQPKSNHKNISLFQQKNMSNRAMVVERSRVLLIRSSHAQG